MFCLPSLLHRGSGEGATGMFLDKRLHSFARPGELGWSVRAVRETAASGLCHPPGSTGRRPEASSLCVFSPKCSCGGGELSPPLPRWGHGSWLTSELRGCRGHSRRPRWAADVFGRVCLRAVWLCGEGICTSSPGVDPDWETAFRKQLHSKLCSYRTTYFRL